MSNIKTSNKLFITLSDLQLFANLNPNKKGLQKELSSLKSKISDDGSINFSEEDIQKLKELSIEKSRQQKKIINLLNNIEGDTSEKKSLFMEFIPDEYYKIQKKLHKYTSNKKFYKWLGNESVNEYDTYQSTQVSNEKIVALDLQIKNIKTSLNITKNINFYYLENVSILNYNFEYEVTQNEIKIFLLEKLEGYLSIDDIYIITILCLSKYLLKDLENSIINRIKYKLDEYIENQSNGIKSDLLNIYGSKWENFIFNYYSIQQLNELIKDRLVLFLIGDTKRIIEFYNKIYKIKEESFDLDEEIYLIEDIWDEQNISKEIFNNDPEHKLRLDFLESYKGPNLFGKEFKKVKIWTIKDRKEIKEHYF
jgi:hypothetical protein